MLTNDGKQARSSTKFYPPDGKKNNIVSQLHPSIVCILFPLYLHCIQARTGHYTCEKVIAPGTKKKRVKLHFFECRLRPRDVQSASRRLPRWSDITAGKQPMNIGLKGRILGNLLHLFIFQNKNRRFPGHVALVTTSGTSQEQKSSQSQ